MHCDVWRKPFQIAWMVSGLVLLSGVRCPAQESPSAAKPAVEGISDHPQMREVLVALRELQTQVSSLASELREVRADQQRAAAEASELRHELEQTKAHLLGMVPGPGTQRLTPTAISGAPQTLGADIQQEATQSQSVGEVQSLGERLSRIEENQEFLDAKLNAQSQANIESASKYRLRLSGILLANVYGNRGSVDSVDFPEIAQEPGTLGSAGSFGGSLRQSQIGLEGFGPDIAGARTKASVKFDLAGGFPEEANGASMGLLRLRTGTIQMDWNRTSITAGQDALFFAPQAPTSLATLAVPSMSYAGKLWGWTPQLRMEHRFAVTENADVVLQGGILDPLTGDVPLPGIDRAASRGEAAGLPALATHLAWTEKAHGRLWTFGAGGYYGRQDWGFARDVDAWASTFDAKVPLSRLFELSGEFYRGRAVGGLGGGIGQSVLFSGPISNPSSSAHGLNSLGGWGQLKFKPLANFEINGAFGMDNPFARDLRAFPVVVTQYQDVLARNRIWFVNFVYQTRSNVFLSGEFRRLRTFELAPDSYSANHLIFSLGYFF